MYKSNIYTKLILMVSFMVLGFSSAYSQGVEMKLQLLTDTSWGVYAKPVGVSPTPGSMSVASAQATIVMPNGFGFGTAGSAVNELVTSVTGAWNVNSKVYGPSELASRQFISVGYVGTTTDIQLENGTETLLFEFVTRDPCPDSLYLIDCFDLGAARADVCPFCPEFDDADYPQNTSNSNPGNNFTSFDPTATPSFFDYQAIYAPSAWSCADCDGDGILNGLEDTNGNGTADAGDVSDMCDACDPFHIQSAALNFINDAGVICAGDIADTAYLVVDIVTVNGYEIDPTKWDSLGWNPFVVTYTDGTNNYTINNYNSGDSIAVVPTGTETYQLVSVVDSFSCEPHADSLLGAPTISVHGPISVTDPVPVTECSEDGNSFSVVGTNAGDGTITYNWQLSTDDGATYANLDNVQPYTTVFTNTLNIQEVAGLNGNWYRCAIATEFCDTVYSAWAELTVDGPISVTAHPTDVIQCDGGNVTFTGGGNNPGVPGNLEYQWQLSTDSGATWNDIAAGGVYSNVDAATINLTGITVSMDGYWYRLAIFTPTCSRIFTDEAVLDVQGPLSFSAHPQDFADCAGDQVFFAFEYANPGTGNVTYQWQQSCDEGATWTDLVEGDPYGGTNGVNDGSNGFGDTLVIADVIGLDSCLYRVEISTSTCSSIYSNQARLDVSGNAEFTSISADDLLVCSGNDTIIVACANIAQGDFYWTWEYSDDNGVTWDSLEMGVGGADAALFSTSSAGALMSTGCDTLIISDVTGMYDRKFRALAQAANCGAVISEEVQLRVEGPLSTSLHPVDATVCAGDPVTFNATIANPGFSATTYVWQVNDGSGWVDLANNSIFGGVNSDELIIGDPLGFDQYQFRLSAKTGTCNEIFTNAATLTVDGPIIYNAADDPQDVTLCYDDSFSFTSAATLGQAGTLDYQWQTSYDDGLNWVDIDGTTDGGIYTNFNTATLNGSSATGRYANCYRLAFSTGVCAEVYSGQACLNVEGPISITDQPDDITECSGDPVTFMVAVDDASPDFTDAQEPTYIQFQWQESTDGGTTYTDLADGLLGVGDGVNGVNTDTLSVIQTAGRDGNLFRVIVTTDVCDDIISDAATFFIEGPVSFTDQPDDVSQCSSESITFTAATANPGLGTVAYQWEYSNDDGANWSNISAGGANNYSGVTGTTLTVGDVVGLYDDWFRLKAWTQYCDTLYSEHAILTVEGPIEFTSMPVNDTICSGEPACFNVEVLNNSTSVNAAAINFQWQASADEGATWSSLPNNSTYNGTTTKTMCVSDVVGLDSFLFRTLIWTTNCDTITGDSARLIVEGPVDFTRQPDDITQCSSEEIYFVAQAAIAVGNSGTISYQWQQSPDGINFSDISAGGVNAFAGVTTDSLIIGNVVGLHDTYYRLSAATGVCNEVYSFDARLSVEGPLAITLDPVDIQECDDAEAFFFSNVSNGAQIGQDGIFFQWELSTDNGTSWAEMFNGDNGTNTINGVESDTLLITPLTGMNGYLVRMKSWTATCDTLTSGTARINVEGPITFTDQPDDVTLCSSDGTTFTVAINNSTGVGTVTYQWEVSANGVIWNDVANGATGFGSGMYSGATTNTLAISEITGLYNYRFRCKVKTATCDFEYSQLAQLFVQGPITFDAQPTDHTICDNRGLTIESAVSLPAASSGALNFQWQENDGSGWVNIANNELTGGGFSMYSNDTGTETGEYFGVTTDDLDITLSVGMNGYQFRLIVWTSVGSNTGGGGSACADTSNVVTLTVLDACSTGTCDFDLDGQDNNTDTDDDNDLLADFWEDWMTANYNIVHTDTFIGAGPFAYLDDLGAPVNYNNCDVDTDNDGLLDGLEDPDGDLISNAEETDGDGIFDGNPLDPCDPILGPTCIGVALAIDVNLQGPKINVTAANPLMRDNLRVQDTLPASDPYIDPAIVGATDPAFVHVGDGLYQTPLSQSQADAVFGVTGANAIVDWVFIELRSSTKLDSIITTRSAFLQRDGDVVDFDGVSDLTFTNAPAGPYYVVVRHRNHLGVMSAEALDLSPIVSTVDFTDPATPTYGDNAQIQLPDGEMYMWAGDVNQDGRTIYQGPGNDVLQIFFKVLSDPLNDDNLANFISTGYLNQDIDLDFDAVYQGPSNDRALLFFSTTLQHPENTDNLANYVILETLP